jgi:hypothetical protein
VKSGGCDPRISNYRKASVRRALKKIIYTPASRAPARLIRYFFSRLDTPQMLSCPRAGIASDELLAAKRVRADTRWRRALELAADNLKVAQGQGVRWQSTNNATPEFSLGRSYEARSDEARSYVGRKRVAAGGATRSGGGGPQDRPPPKTPGTEGFL